MPDFANVKLRNVKFCDRAHLLVWDQPNTINLRYLAFQENAQWLSYRQDLLNRLSPESRLLGLHRHLDREFAAIKQLCTTASKPIVLLTGLDYLITYLDIYPNSPITLFWQSLSNLRQLERILWIILPSLLIPSNWDENRLHRLES